MMRLIRMFHAFLRVGIQTMLQYRGEIFLWAVWGLVNPAVLYAMWATAASGQSNQMIAGFTRGEIAAYYIVIMIVGHLTTAWDAYEMGYFVRSGRLSAMLLRPVLPIWAALASNIAYKIATLAFVVPMWCLFAWAVQPTFHTHAWQLVLGAASILLAALLNFMLGYMVALIAFWSPKLDAVGEVYFGVAMFFGGRLAPLEALPSLVYHIALLLPFRWMFAFPAELTMGRIDRLADALSGVATQLIWIVTLAVAFRIAWAAAVKRYTAVSG